MKISCFELFRYGKYGLFSAKKLMKRRYLIVFFLTFHDILGLRKYGFLCGETCTVPVYNFHLPELNPNKAKVLVYFKYCSLF